MKEERSEKRFVVDSMLGKLAKWLRILGFDTRYQRLTGQEQLDELKGEGFFLITRNQRWCGQRRVLCLDANDPEGQLREIIERIPIVPEEVHPLNRCVLCNGPLFSMPRDQAFGLVPDYIFETNTDFYKCPACLKTYWPGSHPRRMMKRLHDVVGWSF
jgi:uncharacterized protein with PIN domain